MKRHRCHRGFKPCNLGERQLHHVSRFDNAHRRKAGDSFITDQAWFRDSFIPTVQQRGAAIIKARGLSSAASAANAVVGTVRAFTTPTKPGDWFSVAVCSPGAYGVSAGLIYSFPIRSDGARWEIVSGLSLTDFAKSKIVATENELKEEGRSLAVELL